MSARTSAAPASIALDASLRRAVRETGTLTILPEHVMEKVRRAPGAALYILVLDTSSSMRMDRKVRCAKTFSWQLLQESYEKKNRVALIVFRGETADVVVPPTRNHTVLDIALDQVPTGGRTPLTAALLQAFDMAALQPGTPATVVLLSDGRANRYVSGTWEQDLALLVVRRADAGLVIINAEQRHRSIGLLEQLARTLGVPHFFMEELR